LPSRTPPFCYSLTNLGEPLRTAAEPEQQSTGIVSDGSNADPTDLIIMQDGPWNTTAARYSTPAELGESIQRLKKYHAAPPLQTTESPTLRKGKRVQWMGLDVQEVIVREGGGRGSTVSVTVETIAVSGEGRDVDVVCLSSGTSPSPSSSAEGAAKPIVLLVGGHHAREWISVEVAARLPWVLLQSSSSSKRLAELLRRATICVVPLLNPDGFAYSWLPGLDEHRWPKRMWRKNRRSFASVELPYAIGVDLNRNYNVHWGDDSGSSPSAIREDFRGSAPLSEPETAGLMAWVRARHETIAAFVSLHSYGNDIMYPYGYAANQWGPNEPYLRSLVEKILIPSIRNATGAAYTVEKAALSYLVSGDAVDAIYEATHFMPSFTIETRPSLEDPKQGFLLKAEHVPNTTLECLTAFLALAEHCAMHRLAESSSVWNHTTTPRTALVQDEEVRSVDADGNGLVDFFELAKEEEEETPQQEDPVKEWAPFVAPWAHPGSKPQMGNARTVALWFQSTFSFRELQSYHHNDSMYLRRPHVSSVLHELFGEFLSGGTRSDSMWTLHVHSIHKPMSNRQRSIVVVTWGISCSIHSCQERVVQETLLGQLRKAHWTASRRQIWVDEFTERLVWSMENRLILEQRSTEEGGDDGDKTFVEKLVPLFHPLFLFAVEPLQLI
jgi:hypothetical protein